MPREQKQLSFKRMQISKANTVMVTAVAVATFVFIFSMFVAKGLLSQRSYQSKVISKKELAKEQLKENVEAKNKLEASYKVFVSKPENVIFGIPDGSGQNDGDNGRIILDALPSKYDFPALATSVEKLLSDQQLKINSINGKDDELGQQNAGGGSSQPVKLPISVSVAGTYSAIQGLMAKLERSIRPVSVLKITLSGSDQAMKLELTAKTYYQPEKKINIKLEDVQ